MTEPSNIRATAPNEPTGFKEHPYDNSKAIEVLVTAQRGLSTVDFVKREMAQKFVSAAIEAVYAALEVDDIQTAVDAKDKVETMRRYVKAKLTQGKANIMTYNAIAAGNIRVVRELGAWLVENFPQSIGGNWDPDIKRFGPVIAAGAITATQKSLGLGVGDHTLTNWRIAASIPEYEFDLWMQPYEKAFTIRGKDIPLEEMKELYLSHFITYARSKLPKVKAKGRHHHTYQPHIREVHNWIQDGYIALQIMVEEVAKGNTPSKQIEVVRGQLIGLVAEIQRTMDCTGELK